MPRGCPEDASSATPWCRVCHHQTLGLLLEYPSARPGSIVAADPSSGPAAVPGTAVPDEGCCGCWQGHGWVPSLYCRVQIIKHIAACHTEHCIIHCIFILSSWMLIVCRYNLIVYLWAWEWHKRHINLFYSQKWLQRVKNMHYKDNASLGLSYTCLPTRGDWCFQTLKEHG